MKQSRYVATNREKRKIDLPKNVHGDIARVSQYYGENTFDFRSAEEIPEPIRQKLIEVSTTHQPLSRDLAETVAKAALNWALKKGATHFCHWFQPLTGLTAEKHDSFINPKGAGVIESLSATQLMQGEPDASSFPHGGSRSTFEARGYTTWDLSSPLFLMEGTNGKTLCIPTAFISYTGDALDMKTPLLRSDHALSDAAVKFLHAVGMKDVKRVKSTCGPEQEYFLIDREFYHNRPDLVMTGRALVGNSSARNQQLEDHYFGDIPERILSVMQEIDYELYRLGIPSKTRHNEVAPGQYEIAPIFQEANIAADSNQIIMAVISKVATKHHFKALFHEKPFQGINGSGKHLNWSMGTDTGINLLDPGSNPYKNHLFLSITSCVIEALYRHGDVLRGSIASAGNDHRLGANEAPPSIMSAFVGDHLMTLIESIIEGRELSPAQQDQIIGAKQVAALTRDNTDRNRTSPFAFTGNRFEFRACGSDAAVGFPLAIINAAVASVLDESADLIAADIKAGSTPEKAMMNLAKKWFTHAKPVIFNGNGYSQEWVEEAERRGLPNFRNSATAIPAIGNEKSNEFLVKTGTFSQRELQTRYNVQIERYCTRREIEFHALETLVNQYISPSVIAYKTELADAAMAQKDLGLDGSVELGLLKTLNMQHKGMIDALNQLKAGIKNLPESAQEKANTIAHTLMPICENVIKYANLLETEVADDLWSLPTQADMLFLR